MPLSVKPRRERGSLALALLALIALLIPAGVFAARPGSPAVNIQILNASDWHGQIDPVPPGSAWSISKRWAEDRLAHPTLTVAGGDDFGATPPISSFFDEIPSVLAQRMMGVQIGTFGNHNFDRGVEHLQQMIDIAAAPTDADHPGTPYRYVVANLANIGANLTGVEPFAIVNVGGAKVAVIGIINEEAPTLVTPGNFGTMFPTDGVEAANKWAAKARKAGANAVVVITHKGIRGTNADGAFGELVDFAEGVDPSLVDVIIGDHTDVQFSGTIDGILVHENKSKGATYTRTLINVQPGKGGAVLNKSVSFVIPTAPARTPQQLLDAQCPDPAGAPPAAYCDPAILQMLQPYRAQLATFLDPKIAVATALFPNDGNPRIQRLQETALGDLIADGMRWFQGSDFAIINGGGIRAPLITSYAPVAPLDRTFPDADVVIGDIYTILPFTNTVLRRDITGAKLRDVIEHGVSALPAADGRFLQASGFKYTVDCSLPVGSRVTSLTETDGTPIPDDGTVYTLAVINFTNQGGDGFTMLIDGTPAENEKLDAEVFQDYVEFLGGGGFATLDPATYQPFTRITKVNC